MAEPCLRHEVRGSDKLKVSALCLPLTLTLSPRKSGEREIGRSPATPHVETTDQRFSPGVQVVRLGCVRVVP